VAFLVVKLALLLRRNRVVFALVAAAIAVVGAKVGPIHHAGSSPDGFWDGPL
jgi:hypothetical protein